MGHIADIEDALEDLAEFDACRVPADSGVVTGVVKVDIDDEDGRLVCTSRVTLAVLDREPQEQ